MSKQSNATYADKLRQCNREALITVGALVLTIVVWTICGFGLASIPVTFFGIPLWAVCGTVGTWIFAVIVSVVMSHNLFKDFDVEDED